LHGGAPPLIEASHQEHAGVDNPPGQVAAECREDHGPNLDGVCAYDAERQGEGQRHNQAKQDLRDPVHRFEDSIRPHLIENCANGSCHGPLVSRPSLRSILQLYRRSQAASFRIAGLEAVVLDLAASPVGGPSDNPKQYPSRRPHSGISIPLTTASGQGVHLWLGAAAGGFAFSISDRHKSNSALMTTATIGPLVRAGLVAA